MSDKTELQSEASATQGLSSAESAKLERLVIRILTAVGFDNCDDIWWRTDGEYAPISIFAKCNDLFFWGCADCERITAENIDAFEQAYKESPENGVLLFCCRVRKMRPQGAYYKYISDDEKHLFDACGEQREVGFGNPAAQC